MTQRANPSATSSSSPPSENSAEPVAHLRAQLPIRVGIGGWTYPPWRNNFYPEGLVQAKELEYASRTVTTIEINGTYYGSQKPAVFAKWHDQTPDDFVFSMKAPRFATNRRVLAEAGESIERFIGSGISELRTKLGPLLWQFPPGKSFDAEDFEAFLALLPKAVDGYPLRHVLEVRHPSFMSPDYLALARRYRMATVFTDSEEYPSFADITGDFVYTRLMCSSSRIRTGYTPSALTQWLARAQSLAVGRVPEDLPQISPSPDSESRRLDVFIYFINGAKERAPAAACALLRKLADAK